MAMTNERNQRDAAFEMPRTILTGSIDSKSPGYLKVTAEHLLMQIRHNLVVPEKPFFRRGRCVANAAHYVEASKNSGFRG
jgi:hypothetical protein